MTTSIHIRIFGLGLTLVSVSCRESAGPEADQPGPPWTVRDECAEGTHQCADEARCVDTEGYYECHCNDGFEGDGYACVDRDECALGVDRCSDQASCDNEPGGYTCTCRDGFGGDGEDCEALYETIAVSEASTCGARRDGSLWCWGSNVRGGLGLGHDIQAYYDRPFSTSGQDVAQIAKGPEHGCFVSREGELWCWGNNSYGRAGGGTKAPTLIGQARWSKVTAGLWHSCGLQTDGTMWCWGRNNRLQLGAAGPDSTEPVQVGTASWLDVDTNGTRNCGIRTDGTLWCWGSNAELSQIGADDDWSVVSRGSGTTCAIKQAAARGASARDSMGSWATAPTRGPRSRSKSPATQPGSTSQPVTSMCAESKTMARPGAGATERLASSDRARRNAILRIRSENATTGRWSRRESTIPAESPTPRRCAGVPSPSVSWATGRRGATCFPIAWRTHLVSRRSRWGPIRRAAFRTESSGAWAPTARVTSAPSTRCMRRRSSVSGTPTTGVSSAMVKSMGVASATLPMAGPCTAGGSDANQQLGNGEGQASSEQPVRVGDADDWTALAVGNDASCALRVDGGLWCWGSGAFGAPGLGLGVDVPETTRVTTATYSALGMAANHACAIADDGSLWCWGANDQGQLGLGDQDDRGEPTQVGIDRDWHRVFPGSLDSLAIKADGTLWYWGGNTFAPQPVGPAADWSDATTDGRAYCATRADHTLWCWGSGDRNGTAGLDTRVEPQRLALDGEFSSSRIGGNHACALQPDGELWCWGRNTGGQLGIAWVTEPVAVID